MGDLTENFSRREFACTCNCGADGIDMELVEALERVRKLIGTPIHITSGVRCKEHNKSLKNSSPGSSHLKGKAADIHIRDSVQRYKLVMLLGIYFNRVGIGQDFIHIDLDPNKNKEVMWLY